MFMSSSGHAGHLYTQPPAQRALASARPDVAAPEQVGVTAMLVASKYEEIWAPEVKDFVYISDEAYSRQQILDMEKIMLNTLKFNLTVPTPHNFLARFLKAAGTDKDTEVRSILELRMKSWPRFRGLPMPCPTSTIVLALRAVSSHVLGGQSSASQAAWQHEMRQLV